MKWPIEFGVSDDGVRRMIIGRVGFGIGAMVGGPCNWFRWDRYFWFESYGAGWQVRVLWFYFGVKRSEAK